MSKEQRERAFTQDDVNRIVEERLARERRSADTRVVSEPRVYGLDSPHSYYLDTILTRLDPHGALHPESHARMNRYATELAYEVEQRSAEGLRAERHIREAKREADERVHERRFNTAMKELRAVTTGGGTTVSAASQAAAFVPPLFLMVQYALFRDTYRSFADQCYNLPLPPYGMQAYLPYFSSAAAEGQQPELSGVTELDPSTADQSSPVVTIAGQITITQQLNDRFWQGGAADVVFGNQLRQHLDTNLDKFVLNTVINNGTNLPGMASFGTNSLANFLADVSKGRENLTDTAGVRLRPTHYFSTYDFYSYVSDQVGSDGRPLLVINETPGTPIQNWPPPTGADDGLQGGTAPAWSRFTGVVLPGSVLWFTDDNIPASGSNSQVLVSAPDQAVVVAESPDPVLAVFPQTYAGNLAVVVSCYEYATCVTRHASGTAVLTGAGYATTEK